MNQEQVSTEGVSAAALEVTDTHHGSCIYVVCGFVSCAPVDAVSALLTQNLLVMEKSYPAKVNTL